MKHLTGFVRDFVLSLVVSFPVFAIIGWAGTAHAQATPPALPASTTACERAMFAFAQSARCTGVPASGAQCAQIGSESEVMLRECSGLQSEVVSCMNDIALGRRRITGTSHGIAEALSRCTQVPAVASVPRPVVALTRCPSGQHLNAARTACLCDSGQHTVYTRRGGVTGLHVCVPGTTVPGDANFSRYEQRLARLEQQVADLARVVTELERRHQFMCPPNSSGADCRDIPAQLQLIRDLIGLGSVDRVGGIITDLSRRMGEAEANLRRICRPRDGESLADACTRAGLTNETNAQNTTRSWRLSLGGCGMVAVRVNPNQPTTVGGCGEAGFTYFRPDHSFAIRGFGRFGGADFGAGAGAAFVGGGGVQFLLPLTARASDRQTSMLSLSLGVEGYTFFTAGADRIGYQGGGFRGFLLGGSAGIVFHPVDLFALRLGLVAGYDSNAILVRSGVQGGVDELRSTRGLGLMPNLSLDLQF